MPRITTLWMIAAVALALPTASFAQSQPKDDDRQGPWDHADDLVEHGWRFVQLKDLREDYRGHSTPVEDFFKKFWGEEDMEVVCPRHPS